MKVRTLLVSLIVAAAAVVTPAAASAAPPSSDGGAGTLIVDGRRRVPGRHPRRRSLEGGITADAGSLIPLTSNEIRRLFAHLVLIGRTAAEHVLHWSTWRRRRQAQAKASHYRKRLEPP
ncbi:hypothetical protein [Micromonospora craniellae]|uniref:hypothetical protein n=1 Tax=Micromonospora craniellae TaxID=2294034 RepID=UPI00168A4D31|nr:hypothetical protein [Micromonospora craniellae]QOC94263.1 hypothetical protein ID554_12080 [Micromonospora craniellae]